MKLVSNLRNLFLYNGKIDKILLAIFLVINLLVLTNSILHNPEMGYDAEDHLTYIQVLPYRFPNAQDTREFFSPPLPYFLPSFIDKACLALSQDRTAPKTIDDCRKIAGKFDQLINLALSIGITILFIKIAESLRPGNRFLKISSLALLGVMTVYYKTFAQVRGEPYVAFFTIWAIYLVAKIINHREQVTWKDGLGLGVILGLLGLSRQWGFMLFPAIASLAVLIWIFDPPHGWNFTKAIGTSFIIAFLVCGWFYLRLYVKYGSFTAFNRSTSGFSLSNQPFTFFRNTGFKDGLLFKEPTRSTLGPLRKNFENQFFPTFYSEMWGDYWGYFVFIRDKSYMAVNGVGNQEQITPYLGRVNAVSLFPSLIFLGGLLTGVVSTVRLFRKRPEESSRNLFYAFLVLFEVISFLMYFYFLLSYPDLDRGATIKATYMIHALMVLPILGAEFLEKIRGFKYQVYVVCMVLLGLVFLHNLPAMITRYFNYF
jgi:hypothetical protein